MAVSPGFKIFVAEQLAGVGPVSIRPMFGGAGVYADGVMLGLIASETLYLKTNATGAADFEAEGSEPFSYETRQGSNTIASYWQVPDRLFDDADEMTVWVRRALGIAKAAQKPKALTASRKRDAAKPRRK